MIERPDPDALMAGPLGQWLATQNDARAEAKAKARQRRIIGLVGAAAVFVVTLLFSKGNVGFALQLGFFTGAGGFGWAELAKRPVINRIKGGINGAIAEALGLEYSAEVEPGQSFERAKTFALLPSYDNSSFEDLWWGLVGGRPFTLYEARLTEERGSGKSRRTVTVFAGSIMNIGFTRKFLGTTLVERQGEHGKFFGGEKDEISLGDVTLARCDMTDPTFEDRFTVWSNDPVESRYLVHPEYIARLVAIEQAFAGEKIRAMFREGELLIVLESGNLFESGSLDSGQDRMLLERSIAQFGSLADLATKLNERQRGSFN